jgi:hypothetical protein
MKKRPQEGANVVDRVGQRYGKLTVIARAGSKGTAAAWRCRCDCGGEKTTTSNCLRGGYARSCGCSRKTGPGSRPSYRSGFPPGSSAKRHVLKTYRGAARRRGLEWALPEDLFFVLVEATCHYCGAAPATRSAPSRNGHFLYNGIDRINNAVGYVETNVVTCCSVCNHAKKDMPYEAFLQWIERLVAFHSPVDEMAVA